MRRYGKIFALLLCLLLISACSNEPTNPTEKPTESPTSKTETMKPAARTVEEMISQPPGVLMKEHFDEDIEAVRTVNWTQYRDFYEKDFKPMMEKEISHYFQKQKNPTSDAVYDYLVYQLGSGQYEKFYRPLHDFQHGFQAPELPTEETSVEMKQKQTNVVILMDASGSMKATVPGGVKMDLAKNTIQEFASELPEGTNVSLLSYGHIGTGNDADKQKSCAAIESVFPLGPYDQTTFNEATNSFQASGWTPLAGAINQASDILAAYPAEEYKNIVYIVSDGIETCDGDPVATAKKLQEQNIQAKVNIIGFDVDDQGQNQLKQVAEAGGGEYVTVKTKDELETQIIEKWRPSIFEVMGKQGVPLAEYVNQSQELVNYYTHLHDLSNYEKYRITDAIYFLANEQLIDEETKKGALALADEMNKLRNDHFKESYETKKQELEEAKNTIDQQVADWKKQWEQ
ncbi:vWA domain-containing protein [Bacillus sp. FJAT-52991]|uniref:VWA domain-containing protein n=1 Tax=Bacillus kandeliae TaxID=3129297 RepID=A0ABZ2N8T7_9BACI